jgi:hypothetical protein
VEESLSSKSKADSWDVGFEEEVYELTLLEEDESDDVEHILLGRPVEDEGESEGHKGDDIFVSSSNSDATGDMAGELDEICGVEGLGHECLSGMSEEDWAIIMGTLNGIRK